MVSLGAIKASESVGHDVTRTTESKARTPEAIERSMRRNVVGREISVNRVSEAECRGELAELVRIILTRGTSGKQQFQGWGMLGVREITDEGFEVEADPAPAINQMAANPYHALIVLPEPVLRDRDELLQLIKYLSELAAENWKPCPTLDPA